MKPTASSTVDRGYENRLGQTKDYEIDIDFSALSNRVGQLYRRRKPEKATDLPQGTAKLSVP
jgi:hypothetical protein